MSAETAVHQEEEPGAVLIRGLDGEEAEQPL